MMTFPSTFNDERLLTYQVSDAALETAGRKEIAVNFTLGSCMGLSVYPAINWDCATPKIGGTPCQTAS
jgi:hypothetical protein